jgi:hypothetical protein
VLLSALPHASCQLAAVHGACRDDNFPASLFYHNLVTRISQCYLIRAGKSLW